MVHTPANTKECPYQRHSSEEPHILTKQDKMKQQICNINNMKSIFGPFQSLHNYIYIPWLRKVSKSIPQVPD